MILFLPPIRPVHLCGPNKNGRPPPLLSFVVIISKHGGARLYKVMSSCNFHGSCQPATGIGARILTYSSAAQPDWQVEPQHKKPFGNCDLDICAPRNNPSLASPSTANALQCFVFVSVHEWILNALQNKPKKNDASLPSMISYACSMLINVCINPQSR